MCGAFFHFSFQVRQAEYVAEAISLSRVRAKLKSYKPMDVEKRRHVNLGKNDAVAMAHNTVLARSSEAKNLRERSINYIWKKLNDVERPSGASNGLSIMFKSKAEGKSVKKKARIFS